MNTEITDIEKSHGWVLYDADCRFCARWAARFQAALARRRLALAPLQAPWVRARLGLPDSELLAEMRLLKPGGELVGGADALLEISRQFWWAWPFRQLGRIPAARRLLRAGYRWVARHRHCAGNVCQVEANAQNRISNGIRHSGCLRISGARISGVQISDLIPLLVLPSLALLAQAWLAPWVFMWAMALALYAGCKWLTYRAAAGTCEFGTAGGTFRHSDFGHSAFRFCAKAGYLLAWPGMNAAEFFDRTTPRVKPGTIEWASALAKTSFGVILLWGMARLALPAQPLLAGWMGMIGVVFILHFGLFHLLSLAWRQAGMNAAPVMQNPLLANSPGDFWGARWNTAFNELAFRFTYLPLRRRTTPTLAMLSVFGLSGLIHELVISLPARGGYGLPALYFVTQGLGVILERSRLGRNLGLGHRVRGRLFTFLITAGPIGCLFHPPFIHHVILPMLAAIGAT